MQTVVSRLYTQLVQVASSAMFDRWAITFDALVAELTRGRCQDMRMLAQGEANTEIDLSGEIAPDHHQDNPGHKSLVSF